MKIIKYISNEIKVLTLVLSMWLCSNTSSASEIIFNFETDNVDEIVSSAIKNLQETAVFSPNFLS